MKIYIKVNWIYINLLVVWVYFMDWNIVIEKSFYGVYRKVNESGNYFGYYFYNICYLNIRDLGFRIFMGFKVVYVKNVIN